MLVSPKAAQAAKLISVCLITAGIFVLSVWAYMLHKSNKCFLPSRTGAEVAQAEVPVHIMSTIDLQRELNRRYPMPKVGEDGVYGPLTELEEDGVYGPLTEAAHVRAIGDQYAKELR